MISVIIDMYNSEKTISKTLTSFQNQTNQDFEIILVDDCSTDNSLKIAQTFLNTINLKIFKNEVNKGVSQSLSFAVTKATGDYLTVIDSDDTVNPDFIEVLSTNNNSYDFIEFGYSIVKDSKIVGVHQLKNQEFISKSQIKQLLNNYYLSDNHFTAFQTISVYKWASLIKTEIVLKFIDEYKKLNFKWYEDLVFKYFALANSSKIKTINYIGTNYYQYKYSLSKTNNYSMSNLLELRKKLRDFLHNFSITYDIDENIFSTMEFDVSKLYLTRIIRSQSFKFSKCFYKELKKDQFYKEQIKLVNIKGESIKRKLYYYFLKYKLFLLLFISFKYFVA